MAAGKKFDIEPIGLGARDSLRLGKKRCAYTATISIPVPIRLKRGLAGSPNWKKGPFIGREALLKIKETGLSRKLVAFTLQSTGFPRHEYEIYTDGNKIGYVTSGTVSPMLEKGIGLGYVLTEYAKIGTKIAIKIRDKMIPAEIIKPPFV